MVKRRLIAGGAALCACAVLMGAATAAAEEKRIGDYIYVPAMQVQTAAGTISLRVEGLALDADSDEATVVDSLAGAEFGVYVVSGSGELTPWANPLYPSEPMRIRTGEAETRFTLPQGLEFYLRQETAPQGYLCDETALIPVTGDEIVVRNEMAGELVLSAADSMGSPLENVEMTVTDEDGQTHVLRTDENGEAVFLCTRSQMLTVRESALPEGVFAARSVTGGEMAEQEGSVRVEVRTAVRSRVQFGHPAAGTVQLNMMVCSVDENAQQQTQPLADVRLDILSDPPVSIVTDAQGQAAASLLEGTYGVRLSYEGTQDVRLPLSEGQMIVSSGSTTVIDLTAAQATGRIAVLAVCDTAKERTAASGSITLVSGQTGMTYGPYALDAEGLAVTEPLPAGAYRLEEFVLPEGTEFGGMTCGGETAQTADALTLTVQPGEVTLAEIHLLTRESQTFELVVSTVGEDGEQTWMPMAGNPSVTLVSEADGEIGHLNAEDGRVRVEALSGLYRLILDARDAQQLGVQEMSGVFALPSAEDTVTFASDRTRLMLMSVDENGMTAPGAVYALTDSEGSRYEVRCDEDGMAVTPLLAPGAVHIETLTAPALHDASDTVTADAKAGEAIRVQMVHPAYGSVRLGVYLQSLDEQGNASLTALPGAGVQLYRLAQDGVQMTDTGLTLVAGEDGVASTQLAPGEYVAMADTRELEAGCRAPQALRFVVENTQTIEDSLVCMDAMGGVRVRLTGGELDDAQLAQVRFELASQDGSAVELTMQDGAFYAGGLAAGTYVLRQTQIPRGYTLAQERSVSVSGGEVTVADVPLEEYAVVSVLKTGLTFDDALKTYVVPLSGEYGVYTMENGVMKPYPSESDQVTLWSNVTPEQIAGGQAASAKLPASLEGTTYYLHELGTAQGFAADETYYEITLRAGESRSVNCAVSSDRGFFSFDLLDASTGEHVPGGMFELIDRTSGETVLAFELGEERFSNAMAIPVGEYTLRQTQAAQGYALSAQPEIALTVEPYLTEGGQSTSVSMEASRIPDAENAELIADLYTAREQGLTLLTVETAALERGEALIAPQLTVSVGADGSERSDIVSLVLSGVSDAQDGTYIARVEYCLSGGGWQPSDARMTGVLAGPTAVSLDDVQDDISAVRVTYLNAQTGEEAAAGGFMPGEVTLSIEAGAQGELNMHADASFSGRLVYRTEFGGPVTVMERRAQGALSFTMQTNGLFDTVCAGRDGRISGVAFLDADADGVMDAEETGRYAGLTVSLLNASGDVINAVRTGADGSYAFDTISSGQYRVQFSAGDTVVFSSGSLYTEHRISAVEDTRYGASALLTIDGDHTDYIVNAGCIYAAELRGSLCELEADGTLAGLGGLSVELREVHADADEEPIVVVTDDRGEFAFSGLVAGEYEAALHLPHGYLFEDAQQGRIVRRITLNQGDSVWLGSGDGEAMVIQKACAVSGAVRVDDDGDGVIAEGAPGLEGVRVALLRAQDGYTEPVAQTVTGSDGEYAFSELYAGEYSVLFELDGDWAFTRGGADSQVYGAVAQSGSTKTFALAPGETAAGVDAGVTIPAQMSVSVFKDTQFDGQKGTYEEMLAGVSISLIRQENGEDAEEITYKTDEDGTVVFAGVSPGEYVIAYQMPGQWRATKQVDGASAGYPVSCVPQSTLSSGRSGSFTLTMGQSGLRLYIGAMLSGSISGTVYYDDNADALLGEEETYCEGVKVELLGSDGQVAAQASSGADGSYAFEGLAPGRYSVRFTAPQDCGFSATERTMARGGVQQSDTNVSTTRTITVSSGTATASADAGVVRLCSLTGRVWEDRNADCLPDAEENGVAGLTVNLMNSTGRSILASVTTDGQGVFTFERLRPGTYKLRVDGPQGHVFSGTLEGSGLPLESVQSGRGYTAAFTLLGGVQVQNVGFGVLTQGAVSGMVWEDGNYDGMMGETEPGLRGATVALLDASGTQVASTQTIRSGEFTFDSLMPGEYAIRVTLPDGYVLTADGADSAAPHEDGCETTIDLGMLEMGGAIGGVQIGALRPAQLGGVVWMDQDDDGRRVQGDAGMAGVRVALTVTDGADAGKTYETFTDETGAYSFPAVMPGSVRIGFELADGFAFAKNASGTKRVSSVPKTDGVFAQTDELTIASGETRTDIDVGAVGVGTVSGAVWTDSAYDGKRNADEPGVSGARIDLVETAGGATVASAETDETGAFVLDFVRAGEYALRVTLPQGMIFTRSGESAIAGIDEGTAQTQAFSLAMGESRVGVSVGSIVPAALNGRIVVDANENGVCDADEEGLSGAVVTVMQGGTVVATARTDEDGGYAFSTLRPGTYRLRYALASDALFVTGSLLTLTDPDATEGETGAHVLVMGQTETLEPVMTVRAAQIAGRAWMDEDVDGVMDAQEAAMTGVTAELLDEAGMLLARHAVGSDGAYSFTRLRSGTYSVRFTLGEGVLFTDCTGEPDGSCVPVVPGQTGETAPFALGMGEQRLTMNVGGILPGEIGDTVWLDTNGNGLQDYREPLLPGVSLTLLRVLPDGSMEETATTESDKYGYYRFESLRPGTYVLRLNAQAGDVLTFHFGDPLGEIDSELDPDTGMSAAFALRSGQTLLSIDVGLTEHN